MFLYAISAKLCNEKCLYNTTNGRVYDSIHKTSYRKTLLRFNLKIGASCRQNTAFGRLELEWCERKILG